MVALASALNMVPQVIEYHILRAGGGHITPTLEHHDLDLREATRTLEVLAPGASTPTPVEVEIAPPYQEPDSTWTCVLTIRGLGDSHVSTVHHADAVGAILEALYLAPQALAELVEPGARLTYRGGEDLGFPIQNPRLRGARALRATAPKLLARKRSLAAGAEMAAGLLGG
ncbi:MAG: hypothetical protein IPK82_26585 [Polyangiaceae bacterium]|nr:hypothetical protein [Polyangiaceae bacterium]